MERARAPTPIPDLTRPHAMCLAQIFSLAFSDTEPHFNLFSAREGMEAMWEKHDA